MHEFAACLYGQLVRRIKNRCPVVKARFFLEASR